MSKHCDGIFHPLRVCESFGVRITSLGPRWRMNLQKQRPVIFLRRISTPKQCKKKQRKTPNISKRIQQQGKKGEQKQIAIVLCKWLFECNILCAFGALKLL